MKLWILSDLHIDLDRGWELPAPPPAHDVLVVAGDLIPRMERGVRWLHARVRDAVVIYVAGNHEAYGADIDCTIAKGRAAAGGTNIYVLENDVRFIGGVRFLGTTLWTDFRLFGNSQAVKAATSATVTDDKKNREDRYARRLQSHHTLARQAKARAFIVAELSRPFTGPTVIVTHHAVDPITVATSSDEAVAPAYASEMSDIITQFGPTLWVHGHIHRSADRIVGRTRVVANPKGHPPPYHNPYFDPFFTVEIS